MTSIVPSPVVVAGMHRAGTSMVAHALELGGLHLGAAERFVPPAPDNPEGFYEYEPIVRLNEDLLEATGGAWDRPPEWGLRGNDARVAALRERAVELIGDLTATSPWGWKDPRTSLTAPFWLDLLPDARFVICVRNPLDVAVSLHRRNRSSYSFGLSLWRHYYDALLTTVPEAQRLVTRYEDYFGDDVSELARLVGFAGLPAGAATVASSARNATLRHNRIDVSLDEAGVPRDVVAVYHRLCEEAGHASENGPPSDAAPGLNRAAIDLAVARTHLERRGRQVASLERREAELTDQLAAFGSELARTEALAAVHARLDSIEDTLQRWRLGEEGPVSRNDAAMVTECRRLVREHTVPGERVLVIAKGDPMLLDLTGRTTSNFPQDEDGRYTGFSFSDSAGAIAHLEARRTLGDAYLLIPASAMWWLDHYRDFYEHLLAHYQVVAGERNRNVLLDLRTRTPDGAPRAVSFVVGRFSSLVARPLAILDWTGLALAEQLPGRNVFTPPAGATLPYLGGTVDMVLVDDLAKVSEARRVAQVAIVAIAAGPLGPRVVDVVELTATPAPVAARVAVVARDPVADRQWLARLDEALGDEDAVQVMVGRGRDAIAAAAKETDAVMLVEPGVVPLPGCVPALLQTLAAHPSAGAVAPKLLAADGSLEAAGATVFADGSVAGIGAGSHQIRAPWHEHVRPVCFGPGVLLARSEVVRQALAQDSVTEESSHAAWAAAVWAVGARVLYQPNATAFRAGNAEAPLVEVVKHAWSSVLASRPQRPLVLDETAWRTLLVVDDVKVGWT